MWRHQGNKNYELDDIMLLKVGRHVRPNDRFKMIIGREEGENRFLSGYRKQFPTLRTNEVAGPLVLLDGEPNDEDIQLAARITARFSQGKTADEVDVLVTSLDGHEHHLLVKPMEAAEIPKDWYL